MIKFFLGFVCGTRAQNLSAPFCYTLYQEYYTLAHDAWFRLLNLSNVPK
jgi:hypothetical protein